MASPFAKFAAEVCFGKAAAEGLDKGTCPMCGQVAAIQTITNELEMREFKISGMCKKCQDEMFGSHQ